jgi:TatD DNase family protein
MTSLAPLTDSHAHLGSEKLVADLEGVLARARAAAVTRVLNVSSSLGDATDVVALAERVAAGGFDCFAAIGVHPHEASGYDDVHEGAIRSLASREIVVAIGEIGLDYHYDHSPRDVQQDVFRRQLRLAREVGLPVVIHTREAEDDTARILEEERAGELGGVLHCFTSSGALADRCLAMGLYVSFSGIVTFGSAGDLREVAKRVPLERLMVETDAPYLAPIPHRGKPNEPAYVRVTAEAIASIRGIEVDELARATSESFETLFLR